MPWPATHFSFSTDRPAPLPVRYRDYIQWQEQRSAELNKQVTYWQRQLEGAPPLLELPTDRPRPTLQRNYGAIISFQVPARLKDAIAKPANEIETDATRWRSDAQNNVSPAFFELFGNQFNRGHPCLENG